MNPPPSCALLSSGDNAGEDIRRDGCGGGLWLRLASIATVSEERVWDGGRDSGVRLDWGGNVVVVLLLELQRFSRLPVSDDVPGMSILSTK